MQQRESIGNGVRHTVEIIARNGGQSLDSEAADESQQEYTSKLTRLY